MLPLPLFVMASEIGQDTLCPSTDEVRLLFVQKSEYHTSPTIHQSKLFYSKFLLFGVVIVEVPHCRRYDIVGRSEKGCIRRRPLLSLKHLYWMGRPFLHIYCLLWYTQCVHSCGKLCTQLWYTLCAVVVHSALWFSPSIVLYDKRTLWIIFTAGSHCSLPH